MPTISEARAELGEFGTILQQAKGRPWAGESVALLREGTNQLQRQTFIREMRVDAVDLAPVAEAELMRAFNALGVHVASVATELGGLVIEATRDEEDRVNHIVTSAGLNDFRTKHLNPIVSRHWQRVSVRMAKRINSRFQMGVNPRDLARVVMRTGGTRAGLIDLTQDTKDSLFRALNRAREEGTGVRKVARLIREEVPAGRFVNAGPKYRAELISRTETLHAQRISSLEGYRTAPYGTKTVQAFDGDSDDQCSTRNGSQMSIDEAMFESSITHPNCQLAWAPVVI